MRSKRLLAAMAVSAAAFSTAPSTAQTPPTLVNVNLQNVLNDLAVRLNVDRSNIPVTVQLPVQVAANVCGVSINVLSVSAGNKATCTATSAPQTLVQSVQQQMAAGGNATGNTGTSGSATTGGTSAGATGTGTTGGNTGTASKGGQTGTGTATTGGQTGTSTGTGTTGGQTAGTAGKTGGHRAKATRTASCTATAPNANPKSAARYSPGHNCGQHLGAPGQLKKHAHKRTNAHRRGKRS
jgi:hypothetical protein